MRHRLDHANLDITHVLKQLEKVMASQSDISGSNRSKRFIGGLISITSFLGSLFASGMTITNAISIKTIKGNVAELQKDMDSVQQILLQQQNTPQTFDKTVRDTVVMVNTHTTLLNYTIHALGKMYNIMEFEQTHILMNTA